MQLEVSGSLAAMCTRLLILITSTKPVTCTASSTGQHHCQGQNDFYIDPCVAVSSKHA